MAWQWTAFLTCLLTAAATVSGAYAVVRRWNAGINGGLPRSLAWLLGLGAGAFAAAVCLDVLPDALDTASGAWWLLLGACVMWCATFSADAGFVRAARPAGGPLRLTPVAAWVLVAGLSLHTLFEGGAVSLALQSGGWRELGFVVAVILHKLPEGILWGLALAAAFPESARRLTRLLWIPALCTLAGMGIGMSVADLADALWAHRALAMAGGAMLYIGFAELIPSARDAAQVWPRAVTLATLAGALLLAALVRAAGLFGGAG
jgi:zinc transporter ZupT